MSNPKLHQKPVFAGVLLVLTFANEPAATEYACQNRTLVSHFSARRLPKTATAIGPAGARKTKERTINIGAKSRDVSLGGRPKPVPASPVNVSKQGLSARLFASHQTPI